MGLLDFIERGPERTEWLSDTIGGAVEYLTPPNLRPVVEMAAQFNPIQGMSDSMSQFGVAMDPARSMDERRAAAMGSAVEGLLAVVPAAMASQGYMKPVQASMEGLLGWSPAGQAVGDELGRFVRSEGGSIGFDPVTQRGDEILDLLKRDPMRVTDDMLDMGADTPRLNEYLFRNYDLPMDQASRMARAEEMGFSEAAYHGTDRDFSAFDSRRFGEKDPGWYGRGVTTDTDPEVAGGYANYNEAEVGQQILPLTFGGRYIDWPEGQLPFGNRNDAIAGTRDMQSLGYSGSKLTNDRDLYGDAPEWGTEYVTFDPTNIRSRFARFDPRLSHLKNLSAGIGAAGLFGLLSPQEQQGGI